MTGPVPAASPRTRMPSPCARVPSFAAVSGVRGVRAFGEEGEAEVPYPGRGVPDQPGEQLWRAGAGVEASGEQTGVGAVEGVADRLVRSGGHRRSVDGAFTPSPRDIRTPGSAPALP